VNTKQLGIVAAVGVAGIAVTVFAAMQERTGPARCPPGLVAAGARCCGVGQAFAGGVCKGRPLECAETQSETRDGCTRGPLRVRFGAARVSLAGAEWDGLRAGGARTATVEPFALDTAEVTVARYRACEAQKQCEELKHGGDVGSVSAPLEPGMPVRNVTPAQAEAFCQFAGGRLPTGPEWVFAAAGAAGRRFPWGATGLVCRRSVHGLVNGPCGEEATGPDVVGSRPDGATPEGVLDLSGNVAEWTREAGGAHVARGGSYRSRGAAELRSLSAVRTRTGPDVGFRCAYPGK
jgi:formylglycine-generating enzyme required for sulfatase activity